MNASGPDGARWSQPRGAAFLALAAYLLLSPAAVYFFRDYDRRRPNWAMMRGYGDGVVAARFERVAPDGTRAPLDRFAALALPRSPEATGVWLVTGEHGTRELTRRLCDALGPGADLRVTSRMVTRRGWMPQHDGSRNLCAAAEPAAPR